jgi:protein ImuA
MSRPATLEELKRLARVEGITPISRVPLGEAGADARLGGGLARGRLHELHGESGDLGALLGAAAMLAARAAQDGRALLWLRDARAERRGGQLHAAGLAELGVPPERLLVAVAPDAAALLKAGADALASGAVGAAVLEAWGACRELDLTATRRLSLAAERGGVTALLVRVDATAEPSAADTRWRVSAAPSRTMPARAPGPPALRLTLERRRGGPADAFILEWNRDQQHFATLPGPVVPDLAIRPVATGSGPARAVRAA